MLTIFFLRVESTPHVATEMLPKDHRTASRMAISRLTFGRIIESEYRNIAQARTS